MTSTLLTPAWHPGLMNDDRSLDEVLATMPRDPSSAVPWYVRMLENPKSPVALAGAIDLFGHDCIHVLLGRGTFQQDEAFVIGFTMGASGKLTSWQQALFRWCTVRLYRGEFRFSRQDQAVFDLGVSVGRWSGAKPLHNVDFQSLLPKRLGEVRRALGIRLDALYQAYETERSLWPDSPASQRLPRRGPAPLSASELQFLRSQRAMNLLGHAKAGDRQQQKKQEYRAIDREPLAQQYYA
jgi:hypothetical protein